MGRKKDEIKNVHKLVVYLLVRYKKARNSDTFLYVKLMKRLNPEASGLSFEYVMEHLKELGLPCYETVSRTRRKVQAEHPELQGDERVRKFREEAEEDFIEYAKS